jgi:spore germination protein GerM
VTQTVERTLPLYWVSGSGEAVKLVSSVTPITSTGSSSNAVLQEAIKTLLAGPPSGSTSAIPASTTLRSLTVKNDGIHVDLSKEFTTGGGSTSMTARLGQVIYTATALDPQVPVWLSIEGKPLETLGGEGLMVNQPITRSQFEKDFSL